MIVLPLAIFSCACGRRKCKLASEQAARPNERQPHTTTRAAAAAAPNSAHLENRRRRNKTRNAGNRTKLETEFVRKTLHKEAPQGQNDDDDDHYSVAEDDERNNLSIVVDFLHWRRRRRRLKERCCRVGANLAESRRRIKCESSHQSYTFCRRPATRSSPTSSVCPSWPSVRCVRRAAAAQQVQPLTLAGGRARAPTAAGSGGLISRRPAR